MKCSEVVKKLAELLFNVLRVCAFDSYRERCRLTGFTISIFSDKGGHGKTLVALNYRVSYVSFVPLTARFLYPLS